jgi:hypothetical protein
MILSARLKESLLKVLGRDVGRNPLWIKMLFIEKGLMCMEIGWLSRPPSIGGGGGGDEKRGKKRENMDPIERIQKMLR